jgi:transketolase
MMSEYRDLDRTAIRLSKQIIEMCTAAGSGHPSSALSLVHICTALMYRIMRYDPKNPWNNASDRLVLSEGHAVPVIYAAYCDLGGVAGTKDKPVTLKPTDVMTLRENDSILDGHPNPAQHMPFFDAATGSLGQGLSVAAGLGCAARLDGSDKIIYCLMGDGESREGQIWEAVDFVVDQKLLNVRMIFNCNGQGQSDYVSPQQSAKTLAAKLKAYNCEVRIIDGHKWDKVFAALTTAPKDKPVAIIAKTVKGWGSKELSSKNYHGKPLDKDLVAGALKDLDRIAGRLGVKDMTDVAPLQIKAPQPRPAATAKSITIGSFAAAAEKIGLGKALAAKKMSTRRAYGAALAALGAADGRIVALDGDVQGSTFASDFAKKYPERYFEAKIAEQNMISAASGLAATGKIPFVSSFGKFLVRGYDQIEMAAITNANIKLCGSHCGVSLGADGPSQMGLPDMAFMRSFAHSRRVDGERAMCVLHPSDALSAFKMTELAANIKGMCYIRTHRPDVGFIYENENEVFEVGGYKQLAEGQDLLIVSSGYMVHIARKAVGLLAGAGLKAGLIDAYSLPLKADGIIKLAQSGSKKILVVEDNYLGGFADEIALAAAGAGSGVTVKAMYVQAIPKSAKTPEEILKQVKLTAEDIFATAKSY